MSFSLAFYIVLRPQGIRKQMKTLRKRHRVHIVLMTVVLKGKMGTANDIQEQPLKYPGWWTKEPGYKVVRKFQDILLMEMGFRKQSTQDPFN